MVNCNWLWQEQNNWNLQVSQVIRTHEQSFTCKQSCLRLVEDPLGPFGWILIGTILAMFTERGKFTICDTAHLVSHLDQHFVQVWAMFQWTRAFIWQAMPWVSNALSISYGELSNALGWNGRSRRQYSQWWIWNGKNSFSSDGCCLTEKIFWPITRAPDYNLVRRKISITSVKNACQAGFVVVAYWIFGLKKWIIITQFSPQQVTFIFQVLPKKKKTEES